MGPLLLTGDGARGWGTAYPKPSEFLWITYDYMLFSSLRKIQQIPGTDPRYPKIQIWQDFLHQQVVEGLGYVPGVCWSFLRSSQQLALQWPNPWLFFYDMYGSLLYIGDEQLPIYTKVYNQPLYKDHYQPTSIMECNKGVILDGLKDVYFCPLSKLTIFLNKAPMELLCSSSDEDFELPSTITTEQHGPHLRPRAFAAIPRHIVGCSIGYHQANRPCARLLPWPLQRHGRGEPEALLRCIRALGGAQPKDKLWKDQLTSLRR